MDLPSNMEDYLIASEIMNVFPQPGYPYLMPLPSYPMAQPTHEMLESNLFEGGEHNWSSVEELSPPTSRVKQSPTIDEGVHEQPPAPTLAPQHSCGEDNQRRTPKNKRPCGYCQSSKVKVRQP